MRILAIDPGPEQSAWLVYNTATQLPDRWGKFPNEGPGSMFEVLRREAACDHLAIETIASYGMAVGAEVFTTCIYIGRFYEHWLTAVQPPLVAGPEPLLVFRREVKAHLCGSQRAKDPNVRQALIDRYGGGRGREGAVGRKASPGPLYGITADVWSALAVAVTTAETHLAQPAAA